MKCCGRSLLCFRPSLLGVIPWSTTEASPMNRLCGRPTPARMYRQAGPQPTAAAHVAPMQVSQPPLRSMRTETAAPSVHTRQNVEIKNYSARLSSTNTTDALSIAGDQPLLSARSRSRSSSLCRSVQHRQLFPAWRWYMAAATGQHPRVIGACSSSSATRASTTPHWPTSRRP